MRYRLCIKGAALALLVLATVADALAGPATDQLKPEIDRVIATIEDPALQAESRTADRRQAVRAITNRIFDWTAMSKPTFSILEVIQEKETAGRRHT